MDELLRVGDVLNANGREYKILRFIGSGANSAAYLAECRHGGITSKCILKQSLKSELSADGEPHFIRTAIMQNNIRHVESLTNQTPPVNCIFEANGKTFTDIVIYNGDTLDNLNDLTLRQYMAICSTIAKTVGYYHEAGHLCLDLKPENIFILQNSPDDTITELVEFIDFDSIRDMNDTTGDAVVSYTKEWAAPEQTNPYSHSKISTATDIYTIGEIVFYLLFRRHSDDSEHRLFSDYPFEDCKREYRQFTVRPDIRSLFTKLFRNTIRTSAHNRFKSVDKVAALLESIVYELDRKDYIIPHLPSVSPNFVGRDDELKAISENLKDNRVLYVTGIGGIGKSTLVRKFIDRNKSEYDVISYLEYEGDFKRTFTDDMQLQISTVSRLNSEGFDEYFARKLTQFKNICCEKRVLFVIDNFSGRITKDMSRIIDCGYDTIIVSRNLPPKNSFASMTVSAITDRNTLYRLIALDLERPMTKEEKQCFDEIITLTQGHTLVLELVARQIAAGNLDIRTALDLIRKNGFTKFSDAKIDNYKDGEEVYDTLRNIITALFDTSRLSDAQKIIMKTMSLFDVRGFETDIILKIVKHTDADTLRELHRDGWLSADKRVRVHPVIAETMRGLPWSETLCDKEVMNLHKEVIAIYEGAANHEQMELVANDAKAYAEQHPRHFIKAVYLDMLASYYDTLIGGEYIPYNKQEAEQIDRLIDTMDAAIDEMLESTDPDVPKYLAEYYLSLASLLIRCSDRFFDEAAGLINETAELIANEPEYTENRCSYCIVSAWYYTLAEPDAEKTRALTEKAHEIAQKVYPTEIEIIDIIYIPTANCWFYHNDMEAAIAELEKAVEICCKYPDSLSYIEKQAELLNCLLDVYFDVQDFRKCRELIAEIDRINEEYKEQGVFREVKGEIRKALNI